MSLWKAAADLRLREDEDAHVDEVNDQLPIKWPRRRDMWRMGWWTAVDEDEDHELEALSLYPRLAQLAIGNFACYPVVWLLSAWDVRRGIWDVRRGIWELPQPAPARFLTVLTLDVRTILYLALDLNAKVYFSLVVMRVRDRVDRVGLPPKKEEGGGWTGGAWERAQEVSRWEG
eukprot:gene5003-15072_t